MATERDGGRSAASLDAPLLIEAKLSAPRVRPGVVDRPRILQALDAGAGAVLTLLGAPAGYGKTTAVRVWCATQDSALAWVSLDAGDNDPNRMWRYIATAVDRIRPGLAGPTFRRLSVAGGALEDAVDELMIALGRYAEPVILVLEDLHTVTEEDCLASRVSDRLFEGEEAVFHVIERIVAPLGLRNRRGLGFQAETEHLRLHQVVITAKPYASTPSKSTTA